MTRDPIRLTERGEWVMATLAGVVAIVGVPSVYLLLLSLVR